MHRCTVCTSKTAFVGSYSIGGGNNFQVGGGGPSQVNECIIIMQRIISNVARKKVGGPWPPWPPRFRRLCIIVQLDTLFSFLCTPDFVHSC